MNHKVIKILDVFCSNRKEYGELVMMASELWAVGLADYKDNHLKEHIYSADPDIYKEREDELTIETKDLLAQILPICEKKDCCYFRLLIS